MSYMRILLFPCSLFKFDIRNNIRLRAIFDELLDSDDSPSTISSTYQHEMWCAGFIEACLISFRPFCELIQVGRLFDVVKDGIGDVNSHRTGVVNECSSLGTVYLWERIGLCLIGCKEVAVIERGVKGKETEVNPCSTPFLHNLT